MGKRRFKIVVPIEIEFEPRYSDNVKTVTEDFNRLLAEKITISGGYVSGNVTARALKTAVAAADVRQSWPTVEMSLSAEMADGE